MTDQQQLTPEQIKANLLQMLGQMPQIQQPQDDWGVPQAVPMPKLIGIPMNINTPSGKLRVYYYFDGTLGQNSESLMTFIKSLKDAGRPLDFWKGGGKQW